MGKEKILHLVFELASAPLDVQNIAKLHQTNLKRVEKAEAQARAWSQELEISRREYSMTEVDLEKALENWTPAAPTVKEVKV